MSLYAKLQDLEQRGTPAVLCTVVRTRGSVPRHAGAKMLVDAAGCILAGTIGGGELESRVVRDALQALQEGKPRLVHYPLVNPAAGDAGVCGGEVEVFVEPVRPEPTVLVVGGGHVGRALVHLAKWLGYRVVLSDDRAEFCTPEAVPGADSYLCLPLERLAREFQFTAETHIVLTTRNMQVDVEGLPPLLEVPHAYLGVIGSRRRWAAAVAAMEAQGVARDKLAQIHAPVGLELNAETPEEIALSILAEITMVRHAGTGGSMKLLGPPPA
jgi:xanthine dehydrogenase accessory factor